MSEHEILCKECQKKIADETYIEVTGDPLVGGEVRQQAIYDAIQLLKTKPDSFDKMYIGVKNYDHFGDQRSDHELCYGPKHGSIVFSIRLKDKFQNGNLTETQREKALSYLESLFKKSVGQHGLHTKMY